METIGFDDEEEALPAPQDLLINEKADSAASVPAVAPPAPPLAALEQAPAEAVEETEVVPPPVAGVPEHLIRRDYVPKIGAKSSGAFDYAIDPITRQQVKCPSNPLHDDSTPSYLTGELRMHE